MGIIEHNPTIPQVSSFSNGRDFYHSNNPNIWLMARGNDVGDRKEETLQVIYALYGHIGSFRIVRRGADRREPLIESYSDTTYAG